MLISEYTKEKHAIVREMFGVDLFNLNNALKTKLDKEEIDTFVSNLKLYLIYLDITDNFNDIRWNKIDEFKDDMNLYKEEIENYMGLTKDTILLETYNCVQCSKYFNNDCLGCEIKNNDYDCSEDKSLFRRTYNFIESGKREDIHELNRRMYMLAVKFLSANIGKGGYGENSVANSIKTI